MRFQCSFSNEHHSSERVKHVDCIKNVDCIKYVDCAWAWFNIALRPQKPQGSLGRGAQDGHLDFHTALNSEPYNYVLPSLICASFFVSLLFYFLTGTMLKMHVWYLCMHLLFCICACTDFVDLNWDKKNIYIYLLFYICACTEFVDLNW